ncbi:MAG TPA: hypothetical protein VGE53_00400 [Candidatus Paceibacterota bacterium]
MLKAVLLASCMTIVCAVPAAAQTAMPGSGGQTTVTVSAQNDYRFERLAETIPGAVANVELNHDVGNGISFNAWAQAGESKLAHELDLTVTGTKAFGIVEASLTAGTYLVRDTEPIYVVTATASIPISESVSLDYQVDHFEGGFEETTHSVAVSGIVGNASLSAGKAHNARSGLDPWFATASVPIFGDSGFSLELKGYWGAGDDQGVTLGISRTF